ncbi:MAG TPA: hypothetical protein VER33_25945 [Polyangiaceae bacterium]|nr:hypothetical protein [Polyangiaceae bacterium]
MRRPTGRDNCRGAVRPDPADTAAAGSFELRALPLPTLLGDRKFEGSTFGPWEAGEAMVETHPQALAAGLTNDSVALATRRAGGLLLLTPLSVPSLAVRSEPFRVSTPWR